MMGAGEHLSKIIGEMLGDSIPKGSDTRKDVTGAIYRYLTVHSEQLFAHRSEDDGHWVFGERYLKNTHAGFLIGLEPIVKEQGPTESEILDALKNPRIGLAEQKELARRIEAHGIRRGE